LSIARRRTLWVPAAAIGLVIASTIVSIALYAISFQHA
jgi:hypothetical protein